VQDILIEDPVCHTYIPKGQAVQLHHDKKMFYFCSDKCCEMFLKQKGAEK
jgi:YHS domain-containing protein